jgi:hypothetical protein
MYRFFPSTARLIVAKFVIPELASFDYGKWADLQMLICVGGRERTETKSVICCRPQDSSCRKWLLQVPRCAFLLRRRTINRGFVVILI